MMSSKSTANRYGDNTEPCLTPKSIFKNADKDDFHLTHVQQLYSEDAPTCQEVLLGAFCSLAWWEEHCD